MAACLAARCLALVASEPRKVRTLAFAARLQYIRLTAMHHAPRGNAAAYGKDRFLVTFQWIIGLLLGAVLLSALARRTRVPYPTFLALGGMLLAFLPGSPSWTLEPDLALALFVAPVLLDAAFDTSLRDLRDNWLPVSTLVFIAVGLTTATVAVLAHWLVPGMPWAAAIALGAIVAPPDAAAATAILRQVKLPYRLLKILEGESLLNDASAL